jgi:LysR family transcriptional regulator, hca operon transcriptional activator
MELRHLRYFIAVAEEGSLTLAADRRLHTAQPSLSRQIRDLEAEVGVQLLVPSPRGIELTAAGRAFLDHARLALSQVEAAGEAARRAAYPAKASFVMGFLTGTELEWLPEAVRILRGELPNIEIVISSQTSPELASALLRQKIDVAFLRPAQQMPDLVFTPLIKEPLIAVLRTDHRLAALAVFSAENLIGETFISVADNAPAVRAAIDDYLSSSGFDITPDHEATSTYMAISLVVSTRGIALLPLYTQNFLPPSATSRPIKGEAPTIDLALGYHKENNSPLLKLFLSKVDNLIDRVSTRSH